MRCWPNPKNHRDLNYQLWVKLEGELMQTEFSQVFHMR
jgi:hypothetical protein